MVFSSMVFLFGFLPLVLAVYYILPQKFRHLFLLGADLLFYGWGEPVFILIMLAQTALCFGAGLLIEKHPQRKALWCAVACIGSLMVLAWFKYAAFACELVGIQGIAALALPAGISFYTFQTLSYVVDVYRQDVPCQHSFVDFSVYVTLFPQLIAGPIVRYKDIAEQLSRRGATQAQFARGINRFVTGLAKKVLIANRMGAIWDAMLVSQGTGAAWFGAIAYSLQIYFDFSGYSDMALGLGAMLGFDFCENFNFPYISKSITEFWRRWHISLSAWFRDYVYIPLGGSRKGKGRTLINLLIVWLLTGLWHGAGINFVAWGLYYFLFLMLEKLFFGRILEKLPAFFSHALTLLIVLCGWVIFACDGGFGEITSYFARMFTLSAVSRDTLVYILRKLPLALMACAFATPLFKTLWQKINTPLLKSVLCAVLLIICIAALCAESYNPFLYFRF